jgi:methyl-accepting chemotaxis protein
VSDMGFNVGRPSSGKPSFARRTFLIKQRFQLPFVFYPITFFTLFMIGAGYYLHGNLTEILEFHLYSSHNDLQNVWTEVQPAVLDVSLIGGVVFICIMGLWVVRHFSVLKNDLKELHTWLGSGRLEEDHEKLFKLKDDEVRSLAEKLYVATENFESWDRESSVMRDKVVKAAREVQSASDEEFMEKLAALRRSWRWYWDKLGEVRIDEELS